MQICLCPSVNGVARWQDGQTLLIESITGGLVQKWNTDNPGDKAFLAVSHISRQQVLASFKYALLSRTSFEKDSAQFMNLHGSDMLGTICPQVCF